MEGLLSTGPTPSSLLILVIPIRNTTCNYTGSVNHKWKILSGCSRSSWFLKVAVKYVEEMLGISRYLIFMIHHICGTLVNTWPPLNPMVHQCVKRSWMSEAWGQWGGSLSTVSGYISHREGVAGTQPWAAKVGISQHMGLNLCIPY